MRNATNLRLAFFTEVIDCRKSMIPSDDKELPILRGIVFMRLDVLLQGLLYHHPTQGTG
jgi:hypothetical protein